MVRCAMSTDLRQRIALAVIELRMRRGWDRAELARRVDVSESEIDRIETATGPSRLRIDELGSLAEALEVPVERLVEEPRDVIH
jgi:transcriptional regulator with XRE-family HTH domain